jgi:hypothetical protein
LFKMAVGHSDDVDPDDAIEAVIEQCRSGLGGLSPQAAILVAAYESFRPAMLDAVQRAFPGTAIVGATSAGEMSSVGGYQEDSVSLTAFASDVADVTVGFATGLATDLEGACRAVAAQALAATALAPVACVVLAATFVADPQRTIEALAAALPDGVVILGGGSARETFRDVRQTLQFGHGEVCEDGIAVVLFSGPVAISTAVGTGWTTIGRRGTVTRSAEGRIDEIDGHPALAFVSRYVDDPGPGLTLGVFEDASDDFYLRTMLPSPSPDSTALHIMGSVAVGLQVQLTTADTDQILAGARSSVEQALERFPATASPEAALVFSCAGRRALLGSKTRVETELVRSVLGSGVPVAGLYCYGEIGPFRDAPGSRLLNETLVTLLLGT